MRQARNRGKSALHRRCDEVLYYVWDPIGVSGIPQARDEYESYVPHVCALLRDGAGQEAIAEYLASAVGEAMGLKPDVARGHEVASILVNWAEFLEASPMSEQDFWLRLEYRLCHEMAGNAEWQELGLWCDGIYPGVFDLGASAPVIEGESWIGLGPRDQERWSFRLFLPQAVEARSEIEWAQLLPPDDVTGWLTIDREAKTMELTPALAIPDGS